MALAFSPILLAALMFFVTPTYFRPMFENFIGLVMLALMGLLTAAGFAFVMGGLDDLRARKRRLGWIKVSLATAGCVLPALWIVLLGPAVIILLKPR